VLAKLIVLACTQIARGIEWLALHAAAWWRRRQEIKAEQKDIQP